MNKKALNYCFFVSRSSKIFCGFLVAASFNFVRAEEQIDRKIIEEKASGHLVLELPEKFVLERYIIGQKKECLLDKKHLELDLQCWFRHQKAEQTDYFEKRKGQWNHLILATRDEAFKILNSIEICVQKSIDETQQKLRDSENEFYKKNPTLILSGKYRYYEGMRDQSKVKDCWQFDRSAFILNGSEISCNGSFESKEIIIKVAGEETPIMKLHVSWSTSFSANLMNLAKIRIPENSNKPNIEIFCIPCVQGKVIWSFLVKESYLEKGEKSDKPVSIKIGKTRLAANRSWNMYFSDTERKGEISCQLQAGKNLELNKLSK